MKTLSIRNWELIMKAFNTFGRKDAEECYFYIEENLYCNQADVIFNFLEWLCSNPTKKMGRDYYQNTFNEFRQS